MSLTALEIAAVVAELAPAVVGTTVRDVSGVGDEDLVFVFHRDDAAESRPLFVLASFADGLTRIHRSTRGRAHDGAPPGAATLRLASLLRGAHVDALEVTAGDRVVILRVTAGDGRALRLRLELFAKHSTWVLAQIDADDSARVIALRAPFRSARRSLEVGAVDLPPNPPPFEPPPSRFPEPTDAFTTNDAIEAHYAPLAETARLEHARTDLRRRLHGRLENRDDRFRGLERRIEEAAGADALRREAELLSAARHTIPRGASEVEVVDYFDPALPTVRLRLDPALDLTTQIDRRFARARKLVDGLARVHAERETVARERIELAAAREEVEAAATVADLARLAADLETRELLAPPRRRQPSARARRAEPAALPYRRFVSADGLEVLVGRSARDNDRLTFQVARGNDLWLHVGGGAGGSHVVVRLAQDHSAPLETLLDAAALAVHYSQKRGAGRAEVLYTPAKHVARIRGAPPGRVQVAGEKRLLVDLDRARMERLLRGPSSADRSAPPSTGA